MRLSIVGVFVVAGLTVIARYSVADDTLWWQHHYADAPSLACAIYHEVEAVEHSPKRVVELIPLLKNKRTVLKDKDGTVVAVRDAAADVLFETGQPEYWLTEDTKVKMIACCPLADDDCARVHVPDLSESQFNRLVRKLSTAPK